MGHKKIFRVIILSIFVLMSGCAHKNHPIEIDYSPTIPTLPVRPALPIKNLHANSSPDQVIKAYVATVYIQKKYIDEANLIFSNITH